MRLTAHLTTLLLFVSPLTGCPSDDDGPSQSAADGGESSVDASNADSGRPADGGPIDPGGSSCTTAQLSVTAIDSVDLLFVVDNSGSMAEEQGALKAQLPRMMTALTTGDLGGDGSQEFSPAKDIHAGVVTTDMGLVGISGIAGCDGFGDDGILVDPNAKGCTQAASSQRFLSYQAGAGSSSAGFASELGCVTEVGTMGCGFEQQLEAALKALWPSIDVDPQTGDVITPNRISFLKDAAGAGALGHGDVENNGFLRKDPSEGLSVVAIVVVSDEEDCSSRNTSHFSPAQFLDPSDPNYDIGLNLRCFYNKQNLYGPVSGDPSPVGRYLKGYRALREGNEHLVVFGAIVGVPPDLVTAAVRAQHDFADQASRSAYYDKILADQRMQETPDPTREGLQGNLLPSCDTPTGRAYPPVRMVQLAKDFGANAAVGSICQEDFTAPVDAITEVIGRQLGAACLPRPLVRESSGLVGCDVYWELPAAGKVGSGAPTKCSDASDYLESPPSDHAKIGAGGGALCRVKQLPVKGDAAPSGDGWYYDDLASGAQKECRPETPQRIAFSTGAKPQAGVTVTLECCP